MTAGSEYEVSSMTWHQWHQTAERERRIGLSWAFASWNASDPHSRHSISWARLGLGENQTGFGAFALCPPPFLFFVPGPGAPPAGGEVDSVRPAEGWGHYPQ